ncbi:hypothetical protein CRENBAI_014044, partial [Crenichthys baileyi]
MAQPPPQTTGQSLQSPQSPIPGTRPLHSQEKAGQKKQPQPNTEGRNKKTPKPQWQAPHPNASWTSMDTCTPTDNRPETPWGTPSVFHPRPPPCPPQRIGHRPNKQRGGKERAPQHAHQRGRKLPPRCRTTSVHASQADTTEQSQAA